MEEKTYKAKGQMLFRLGPDGIETQMYDREYYLRTHSTFWKDQDVCKNIVDHMYKYEFTKNIYGLFDGKEFLKSVQDGCIMDDDGHVADVFVDGFESNLGLATNSLTSGGFLVSEEVWEDICNEHNVEVNWVNK